MFSLCIGVLVYWYILEEKLYMFYVFIDPNDDGWCDCFEVCSVY